MKVITTTLKSTSPIQYSKFHDTPKKDKETHDAHEQRTWRERTHYDPTTRKAFIPGVWFKKALETGAKFLSLQIPGKGKSTYTKHFVAGIMVIDNIGLPVTVEEIDGINLHVPSNGVKGDGKRVKKTFPVVNEWEGVLDFHILDDTITEAVFLEVLKHCGMFNGVGSFRPQNGGWYGRFEVVEHECVEK